MSERWTNQQPFTVTDEFLRKPWSGFKDGRKMRCLLCGVFFAIGSTVRWVYANGSNSGYNHGNFFVCSSCDGPNADVLRRAAELAEKAWAFWDCPKPHPALRSHR